MWSSFWAIENKSLADELIPCRVASHAERPVLDQYHAVYMRLAASLLLAAGFFHHDKLPKTGNVRELPEPAQRKYATTRLNNHTNRENKASNLKLIVQRLKNMDNTLTAEAAKKAAKEECETPDTEANRVRTRQRNALSNVADSQVRGRTGGLELCLATPALKLADDTPALAGAGGGATRAALLNLVLVAQPLEDTVVAIPAHLQERRATIDPTSALGRDFAAADALTLAIAESVTGLKAAIALSVNATDPEVAEDRDAGHLKKALVNFLGQCRARQPTHTNLPSSGHTPHAGGQPPPHRTVARSQTPTPADPFTC